MKEGIRQLSVHQTVLATIFLLVGSLEKLAKDDVVQLKYLEELADGVEIPQGSFGHVIDTRQRHGKELVTLRLEGLRSDPKGETITIESSSVVPVLNPVANVGRAEEDEHLHCPVCELLVKRGRELVKPGVMDIDKAADIVEELCSPSAQTGRWLKALDIFQEGGRLNVIQKHSFGDCRQECSTLQRACRRNLQGREDILAKKLLQAPSSSTSSFCEAACEKSPKPMTGRRIDEIFQTSDSERLLDDLDLLAQTAFDAELLPAGVSVNDEVQSLQDLVTNKVVVRKGDTGRVIGPSKSPNRVDVRFPTGVFALLPSHFEHLADVAKRPKHAEVAAFAKKAVSSRHDETQQVKCQVCNILLKQGKAFFKKRKFNKITPAAVDAIDNICAPKRPEGKWLTTLDLQTNGSSTINVVQHERAGVCQRECHIVQQACEIAQEHLEDQQLLNEFLAVNTPAQSSLCNKTCADTPKPLKYNRVDEVFREAEPNKLAENIVQSMPLGTTESNTDSSKVLPVGSRTAQEQPPVARDQEHSCPDSRPGRRKRTGRNTSQRIPTARPQNLDGAETQGGQSPAQIGQILGICFWLCCIAFVLYLFYWEAVPNLQDARRWYTDRAPGCRRSLECNFQSILCVLQMSLCTVATWLQRLHQVTLLLINTAAMWLHRAVHEWGNSEEEEEEMDWKWDTASVFGVRDGFITAASQHLCRIKVFSTWCFRCFHHGLQIMLPYMRKSLRTAARWARECLDGLQLVIARRLQSVLDRSECKRLQEEVAQQARVRSLQNELAVLAARLKVAEASSQEATKQMQSEQKVVREERRARLHAEDASKIADGKAVKQMQVRHEALEKERQARLQAEEAAKIASDEMRKEQKARRQAMENHVKAAEAIENQLQECLRKNQDLEDRLSIITGQLQTETSLKIASEKALKLVEAQYKELESISAFATVPDDKQMGHVARRIIHDRLGSTPHS